MSTSYIIKPGYNANYLDSEVWEELSGIIDDIQENPYKIINEVFRIEPDADRELITEIAELYKKPVQDLTIKIMKDVDFRDKIYQIASGGGPDRKAKEACRRAVCRLVLEEIHRRKMEICITVH